MNGNEGPLCPSAQPDMAGSRVFAVVGGTPAAPRAGYLTAPRSATPEVLALAAPVDPTEIFRFAAACAGSGCQHFDGSRCQLVRRTVLRLEPVVDALPPCPIRPGCRWWQEEGKAACLRCPQIVTQQHASADLMRAVATADGEVIR
jgi:hypothetical protein